MWGEEMPASRILGLAFVNHQTDCARCNSAGARRRATASLHRISISRVEPPD
jgi:hypothetical protein